MQIELREATAQMLAERAADAGVSVDAYVEGLLGLKHQAKSDPERTEPYTVEEWRANLQRSGAQLGREGRPWREFIHEGHKY